MEQEQSQQVPSQEQLNFLKSFLDFSVEERKKDRQELQKIRELLKLLEKQVDELLEYPKQGGE